MRARNTGNSVRASRAGARRMKWPTASHNGRPLPDIFSGGGRFHARASLPLMRRRSRGEKNVETKPMRWARCLQQQTAAHQTLFSAGSGGLSGQSEQMHPGAGLTPG
jgi:hypothetical protein